MMFPNETIITVLFFSVLFQGRLSCAFNCDENLNKHKSINKWILFYRRTVNVEKMALSTGESSMLTKQQHDVH